MVRDGAIGRLRRVEIFWGEKFDWPAASGFYFGVGGKPHGVLFDKGPHAIDLVCWWLGAKPDVVSCVDDSFGGGEAMATLTLRHGECRIEAHFSYLSRYPNTYTLTGDNGSIEGSLYEFRKFDVTDRSGRRTTVSLPTPAKSIGDFGPVMIDNFLDVIRGRAEPAVPAASVLDSVELIDECYARRERYAMPWHDAWERVIHG
jgi:predicted dehydrogenase